MTHEERRVIALEALVRHRSAIESRVRPMRPGELEHWLEHLIDVIESVELLLDGLTASWKRSRLGEFERPNMKVYPGERALYHHLILAVTRKVMSEGRKESP
jgi:hypothetical protein